MMDKYSELRAAGFSDTEINDHLKQESSKLLSAGFSQQEVTQYLGAPPAPNDGALRQLFTRNLDKATVAGADGQRKPLDFVQAVEAGFGMSVTGLAAKGKLPDQQPTGNEAWYNRIAYSAAQMAGDVPAMIAGGVIGGAEGAPTGPGAALTAAAGAFALPAGLRATMVDAYSKGEFVDFKDFFSRASGILLDTAKGYVTGLATGGAGKAAGAALGKAAPAVRNVGQMGAEIGAMVTVGAALEGHVPSAQDFLDAGILLLGAKGSMKAAEVGKARLMEVYKKTGVPPAQVLADAKTDPTIVQDMATGRDIPRAYEDQVDPMFRPEPTPEPAAEPGAEPAPTPEAKTPTTEAKTPAPEAPVADGATAGAQATPGVTAPPSTPQQVMTQRTALETMAKNLGIEVRLTPGPDFHSSSAGYINVPPEGKVTTVPSLTDSEFIFAHELGHAIMVTRRGAVFGRQNKDGKFSFWSNAKLRREISNWDEFTEASKEMRPEFWDNPALGQQKYVRTPDELVADTIAAVLTGKRDISILFPMMKAVGIKPEGLGLAAAGDGGGMTPGGFPAPAAGTPEPGSLAEAQKTILGKVNIGGENAPKEPVTFEKFYTAALDDLTPIKRAVEEMAAGKDLPGDKDPYTLARELRGIYGRVQVAIEHGTLDFNTLQINGKSLKAILEPVKNDLDGLRAYAISSRALELKDRFLVSGFDIDAASKVVKETSAKYEPIMRELVDYQNRITAYLRDSGVLSDEAHAAMLEANKNYVPFYRMFGDEPAKNGAGAGLSTRNPIKSFKGSGTDIVDPIESIIKNTYTYLTLADRNAVAKEFYTLGKRSGMAEMFFEKVPPSLRATTVTDAEMEAFLSKNGIGQVPAEALTVFRAVRQPLAADEIGFFMEGKWTVLRVSKELADAFKATDRQSIGMLMEFLAPPAKMLRAGTTISPDFIARNFVRDQFSAFVNSKSGFVPIYDTLRGAASIFKQDESFQNWLKSGGANATLVALDRKYIQSEIYKLTGKYPEADFLQKTWNVVGKPIEMLRVTSELIENATRLGEFKRALDASGRTDKAALLEAGMASREITLDFARVGTKVRALNMIAAFFNAGAQGIDRTIRTLKEDPVGSMAKIGMSITLPSVLLWLANKDDPRWKEIPDWQRDLFWIVMTDDHVFRIPKPPILGVLFGSSVERMLDATEGKMDARDLKKFAMSAAGEFALNAIPTAVTPVLEQLTNHSFFTGRDLVPSYLDDPKMGVLPEYRYTEYTSELTKALGHIVGMVPGVKNTSMASPIVIDNYLRAWTGGLGTYAIQAADYDLRKMGVLPDPVKPADTLADIPVIKAFAVRFPAATAESIQRFREDYQERRMAYNTIQTLAKQGDFDAWQRVQQMNPQAFVKLDAMDRALNEQNMLIRAIYKNPGIPPDEKRQLIDATYYNMIQMTRVGNQMMKEIDAAMPKSLSQ